MPEWRRDSKFGQRRNSVVVRHENILPFYPWYNTALCSEMEKFFKSKTLYVRLRADSSPSTPPCLRPLFRRTPLAGRQRALTCPVPRPRRSVGGEKKRERDGAAWCPPWRASQRNYLLEAMLSNKGWWLHRLVRRQGVISLEKGETKDSSQQRVQSGRRPWVLPSKWVRRGRSRRASTSERNLMLSEKQWQALFMEEK